jgi:uncharacterized protein YlxW (UPF0749 family)
LKAKEFLLHIKDLAMKKSGIVATIAQTAANWALNASMGPLLAIILLVVAAIASLAAIIFVAVKAFEHFKNSTPEAKLKAAQEESARLAEELNKAKEAANELRTTIEGYDTAIEKVKTLKKGTQEYKDAVEEANEKARELIEMGELEGKYHFNAENGLIEFDKGALEEA